MKQNPEEQARRLVNGIVKLGDTAVDGNGKLLLTPKELYQTLFRRELSSHQVYKLNQLLRNQGFLESNGHRGRSAVWSVDFSSGATPPGEKTELQPDASQIEVPPSPVKETSIGELLEKVRKQHAVIEAEFGDLRHQLIEIENVIAVLEALDPETPTGELQGTITTLAQYLN